MLLVDVNVLVYAHRRDAADHDRYRNWLESRLSGDEPLGMLDLVLSGFIRIVTHPRIFDPPTMPSAALDFAEQVRGAGATALVSAGPQHWELFARLCRATGAKGNAVPDAFFAAFAIEHGCEWVTTDRSFRRFPGLRVIHPLEG